MYVPRLLEDIWTDLGNIFYVYILSRCFRSYQVRIYWWDPGEIKETPKFKGTFETVWAFRIVTRVIVFGKPNSVESC